MSENLLTPSEQGYNGQGYQLTTMDKFIGLARSKSMWPLPSL